MSPGLGGSADPVDYNVLLVILDDIGVEWFDFYDIGARYTTDEDFSYCDTPFLSQIAAGGLVFDEAYVSPVCGPTRWEILSGKYPHITGTGGNQRDPGSNTGALTWPTFGFASSVPYGKTLPQRLIVSRPEILTAQFGKWHVCDGWSERVLSDALGYPVSPPDTNLGHRSETGFMYARGNINNVGCQYSYYKVSETVTDEGKLYYIANGSYSGGMVAIDIEEIGIPTPTYDETNYNSAIIAADFAAWVADKTDPWFAYVAFGAPHEPFIQAPGSMLTQTAKDDLTAAGLDPDGAGYTLGLSESYSNNPEFAAHWRASMNATDEAIRRVWYSIPEAQRGRTVLIVIGDNGSVGNALPPGFTNPKRTGYWGGTQVPLLVYGPIVSRPGQRVKNLVHSTDIYRTVCEIMRVTPESIDGESGYSFYGAIRDTVDRENKTAIRPYVFVNQFLPIGETDMSQVNQSSRQRAIYDGEYRLLIQGTAADTLFYRRNDPLEATDIAAQEPEIAAALRAALDAVVPDG